MASAYRSCGSLALPQQAAPACSCSSHASLLQRLLLLSQPATSVVCAAIPAAGHQQLQGTLCQSCELWMCTWLCTLTACRSR